MSMTCFVCENKIVSRIFRSFPIKLKFDSISRMRTMEIVALLPVKSVADSQIIAIHMGMLFKEGFYSNPGFCSTWD